MNVNSNINDEEKVPLIQNEEPKQYKYPYASILFLMMVTIFSNQAYSGINAVLALYFSDWLKFSDNRSTAFDSFYIVITSVAAPFGGLLSDLYLGNYSTQVVCYILWTVGCILLLFTVIPEVLNFLGGVSLTILIICGVSIFIQGVGYGMVNPLQSVLVADQFHKSQTKQLISSFSVYYFFSNVGSLLGEFLGPVLREYTSFKICFSYFASSLALGTVLLIVTRGIYRKIPPTTKKDKLNWKTNLKRDLWEIRHILRMFIPLPVFWALFFQQNSTWVFQAQSMDCDVGPIGKIPKFTIPPDVMPSLEDIFCLILIFLFDKLLYPLSEKCGYPLFALRKIGIGFFFISVSFVLAGLLQLGVNSRSDNDQLSILWQIPQIFCMACAEITVAISGLDFAYSQSPPHTRNTVTAIWSLTAALGNGLVIVISLISISNQAIVFFMYAGMMFIVLLVFTILAKKYQYVEFQEEEEEEKEDKEK